jgi:ABC-type sulfate transport system substrate-binding protein
MFERWMAELDSDGGIEGRFDMKHMIVRCIKDREWRCRIVGTLALAMLIAVVIYGRIVRSAAPTPRHLMVYAFSTQQEVLMQSIFPAFEEAWKVASGEDLSIEGVFGPSGTLAGQINLGAPAQVAVFSNIQHVTHLKIGRRVDLESEPVVVSHTPMVIVVRQGNPAGIAEYADLAQPGLQILHADPRSSGAGEWALLAEYGSALQASGDSAIAEAQLEAIWRNVRLLGASARATMTLFELGAGDAFVTYEQDALLAKERGVSLEIVVPSHTIVARHVAVIVDDNVLPGEVPVAQAFVEYLLSDAGQQTLSRYHLRPADLAGEEFAGIPEPLTVDDLGGWSRIYGQVVERLWRGQIAPRLDLDPAPELLDRGE